MALRSNIDNQIRGFYFASSGNDQFDGQTIERPKATIQAAIDAAFALDPIPQEGSVALVNVAQGGSFDSGFVLEDWIQFSAEDVTIATSQAIAVEAASFLSLRVSGVTNLQNSSVVFMIDGKQAIGLEALFMAVAGTNSTGLKITGTVDDLFITLSRILIVGEGSTGIDITSATADPIDININTVSMAADNTTFMNYNPVNALDRCVVDVSTISENGFTSTAFTLGNGILVVEAAIVDTTTFAVLNNAAQFTIRSQAIQGTLQLNDTSICIVKPVAFYVGDIDVNDTATLFMDAQVLRGNIDMAAATDGVVDIGLMQGDLINNGALFLEVETFEGDITVASGATLNCDIASHVGTLTNNGTINGIINGVRYGTYTQQLLIESSNFTNQTPTGTDAPLQVKFGSAQGSSSTPMELFADGTMTANVKGQYVFYFTLQYGRSGAGGASILLFRLMKNGTQLGDTPLAALDTSNEDLPFFISMTLDLEAGDDITTEIIRDSSGNNSGSLLTFNPALAGVNDVPSASVKISR